VIEHTTGPLVCAECGGASPPDARDWRALLTVGDEDAEDVEEVAVYCPECAAREFGGP
jgi:hypothetical protein